MRARSIKLLIALLQLVIAGVVSVVLIPDRWYSDGMRPPYGAVARYTSL